MSRIMHNDTKNCLAIMNSLEFFEEIAEQSEISSPDKLRTITNDIDTDAKMMPSSNNNATIKMQTITIKFKE